MHLRVKLLPAAQIEITHAEIGPVRDVQSLLKGAKQVLVYVVEDTGHGIISYAGPCE